MYVRVKRKKTTIFLHVEPTDTVLEVKQKLQDLVEKVCVCCVAHKQAPSSLTDTARIPRIPLLQLNPPTSLSSTLHTPSRAAS